MKEMKANPSCVVLGDVVGSRRAPDRAALHHTLAEVLARANERFSGDLRVTVGDEYQGHLPTIGQALAATWWIRLHLAPGVDVRHGIGLGPTAVLDDATGIEDGPGWWAAREAIEDAERRAARARSRATRDRLVAAADSDRDPGLVVALNAALSARDELTSRLDERSVSVLRGLLEGRSQREIAEREGISASAVSQRMRTDALGMLLDMQEELTALV